MDVIVSQQRQRQNCLASGARLSSKTGLPLDRFHQALLDGCAALDCLERDNSSLDMQDVRAEYARFLETVKYTSVGHLFEPPLYRSLVWLATSRRADIDGAFQYSSEWVYERTDVVGTLLLAALDAGVVTLRPWEYPAEYAYLEQEALHHFPTDKALRVLLGDAPADQYYRWVNLATKNGDWHILRVLYGEDQMFLAPIANSEFRLSDLASMPLIVATKSVDDLRIVHPVVGGLALECAKLLLDGAAQRLWAQFPGLTRFWPPFQHLDPAQHDVLVLAHVFVLIELLCTLKMTENANSFLEREERVFGRPTILLAAIQSKAPITTEMYTTTGRIAIFTDTVTYQYPDVFGTPDPVYSQVFDAATAESGPIEQWPCVSLYTTGTPRLTVVADARKVDDAFADRYQTVLSHALVYRMRRVFYHWF